MICVLHRCLLTVQNMYQAGSSIQFPFPDAIVQQWITLAREDCQDADFEASLGGTPYDEDDETTFWTQPRQFYTW